MQEGGVGKKATAAVKKKRKRMKTKMKRKKMKKRKRWLVVAASHEFTLVGRKPVKKNLHLHTS